MLVVSTLSTFEKPSQSQEASIQICYKFNAINSFYASLLSFSFRIASLTRFRGPFPAKFVSVSISLDFPKTLRVCVVTIRRFCSIVAARY